MCGSRVQAPCDLGVLESNPLQFAFERSKVKTNEPTSYNQHALSESRRDSPRSWGLAPSGRARSEDFVRAQVRETRAGERTTWNQLEICPQENFEEDLTGITYF